MREIHTELDYDDEKILTIMIVLTSLNIRGIVILDLHAWSFKDNSLLQTALGKSVIMTIVCMYHSTYKPDTSKNNREKL